MKPLGTMAVVVCLLGIGTIDLYAQSSPWTLTIERKVVGTPKPGINALDVEFSANITMEANALGEISGSGTYHMKYTDSESHHFEGSLEYLASGAFTGKTVNVIAAKTIVMRALNPKSHGKAILNPGKAGEITTTLPSEMYTFKGTLVTNSDGLDVLEEVTSFETPVTNFKVATIIRGHLPVVNANIPVAIQHPIQPAISRIKNQVAFVLPRSATFPEGKTFNVRAYLGSNAFRLWEDGDESKKYELRFENVRPGERRTFNYSWVDPPQSLAKNAAYKERVFVAVENTKLEGSVEFDVGIAFKITEAKQREPGPLTTAKKYDLRLTVIDAFHPTLSAAELAQRFSLKPLLTLKQTEYVPAVDLMDVATSQSPVKFLEYWSAGQYSLKIGSGDKPPTVIAGGNEVPFDIVAVGKEFVLYNPKGHEIRFPNLEFRSLGVHWFTASIDKVSYEGGAYDSPPVRKLKFAWCLEDYGGAQKEVFAIIGPCLETLAATPEALESPIAYGEQLGECIKKIAELRQKKE